jgi:bacteriorhodopsin
MADIDIVPKKRTGSAWMWIILAIVVLVVLWMMMGRSSTPRNSQNIGVSHPMAVASQMNPAATS